MSPPESYAEGRAKAFKKRGADLAKATKVATDADKIALSDMETSALAKISELEALCDTRAKEHETLKTESEKLKIRMSTWTTNGLPR